MKNIVLRLIYGVFVRLFLKLFVGVRFGSDKSMRQEKQFIIVANHNSHLDTMSLMAAVPGHMIHKIKPVAAIDHFGKKRWHRWLSNYFINTLLIQRSRDKENVDNDPILKMIHALDKGHSLIVFPEGSRGEPEIDQPLKAGIALVLKERPYVKYIPVYMKGMGKALPKGDHFIVPHAASLVFGSPEKIVSQEVDDILQQIEDSFSTLRN